MTGQVPQRTRVKTELSPIDYVRSIPLPTAYVQFWYKVVELGFAASDAISKFAEKKDAPVLDGDTWARTEYKKVCDGLTEWARHNHNTVSRIPRDFFPTYDRDSNYNFRQPNKDGQDGMNIDDLVSMISAWLPSYTARKVEHHYYLATKRTLRIIDGLDVGEVEHMIPISRRGWTSGGLWLSRFKWRLYARCDIDDDLPSRSSDPYLYSEITLFLNDLPKQLEKGIQWTDDAKEEESEKFFRRQGAWEHHSVWRDPGKDTTWYALMRIKGFSGPSAMTQDPRSFFSQCRALSIDQRTSDLGFKYVVISKQDCIFGNDLLRHGTQPWNKDLHVETRRFFEGIWPKVPRPSYLSSLATGF